MELLHILTSTAFGQVFLDFVISSQRLFDPGRSEREGGTFKQVNKNYVWYDAIS